MTSKSHTVQPRVSHVAAVAVLLLACVSQAVALVSRHHSGRGKLGRDLGPWRGNKFIAREGILPYQKCGANSSVGGARPLHTVYQAGNASYDLLVLAASVWGQSHSQSRNAHAPILETVDFLAFSTLRGSPCVLDSGSHCETSMNAKHAVVLGEVQCTYDFGGSSPLTTSAKIRPPTKPGYNAFVIACPVPGRSLSADDVPDQWTVSLTLGGAVVPVDICYDHVEMPVEVALCMEPAHGYARNSPFWMGNPSFAANHTLVDAALTYHTKLMGAHVRFNDVDADAFDAVLPYTWDGSVSYRSGWRLAPLAGPKNGLYFLALAFEVLADAACHWEFRYRARWTAMISSVDNFAAPLEDISLAEALARAPIGNVSTLLVPIVEGFSKESSRTAGSNILLRYPVAGPELAFGDTRHTPIIDPRHLETARIHWATDFRPHDGPPRRVMSPSETLEKVKLHALHMMAMTRPKRDKAGERSVDPLFWKRGLDLQAHLDRRVSGHL